MFLCNNVTAVTVYVGTMYPKKDPKSTQKKGGCSKHNQVNEKECNRHEEKKEESNIHCYIIHSAVPKILHI